MTTLARSDLRRNLMTDKGRSRAEEARSAEDIAAQKKKALLASVEAKRAGRLAPDQIQAMNVQLRAARRPPIILADADPTDAVIIFDVDPTDSIIVI
jgi:hypothetical protein